LCKSHKKKAWKDDGTIHSNVKGDTPGKIASACCTNSMAEIPCGKYATDVLFKAGNPNQIKTMKDVICDPFDWKDKQTISPIIYDDNYATLKKKCCKA